MDFSSIIKRAKAILLSPKTEWPVINGENDSHVQVLTKYLLIMAAIPALFSFIGYGFIGYGSVAFGIRQAILQYVSLVGGVYICAWAFNMLAPKFGAEVNFNKAFQLVAYCYTATCVGGIFYIHHSLTFLASLASIYSLYLLFVGLEPMMKVPAEKKTSYFVVALLVMIAVAVVLSLVLSAIIIGSAYRF